MDLYDFENHIDPAVLTRAMLYTRYHNITSIECIDKGEFLSVVLGTKVYDVYIKVGEHGEIIQYQCSCPDEYHKICKHIAAVLIQLRNSGLENIPEINLGKEVTEFVNQLNEEQLRRCLSNILKRNRDIRNEMLAKFRSQ